MSGSHLKKYISLLVAISFAINPMIVRAEMSISPLNNLDLIKSLSDLRCKNPLLKDPDIETAMNFYFAYFKTYRDYAEKDQVPYELESCMTLASTFIVETIRNADEGDEDRILKEISDKLYGPVPESALSLFDTLEEVAIAENILTHIEADADIAAQRSASTLAGILAVIGVSFGLLRWNGMRIANKFWAPVRKLTENLNQFLDQLLARPNRVIWATGGAAAGNVTSKRNNQWLVKRLHLARKRPMSDPYSYIRNFVPVDNTSHSYNLEWRIVEKDLGLLSVGVAAGYYAGQSAANAITELDRYNGWKGIVPNRVLNRPGFVSKLLSYRFTQPHNIPAAFVGFLASRAAITGTDLLTSDSYALGKMEKDIKENLRNVLDAHNSNDGVGLYRTSLKLVNMLYIYSFALRRGFSEEYGALNEKLTNQFRYSVVCENRIGDSDLVVKTGSDYYRRYKRLLESHQRRLSSAADTIATVEKTLSFIHKPYINLQLSRLAFLGQLFENELDPDTAVQSFTDRLAGAEDEIQKVDKASQEFQSLKQELKCPIPYDFNSFNTGATVYP